MADAHPQGRGHLIVLEGIDGSGKTTVAEALAENLAGTGRPILTTQEPTDSYVGTAVREALKDPEHDPVSEALLFAADHAGHVDMLRQALADGAIVISDRYSISWRVYQSITLRETFETTDTDPRRWLEDVLAPFELTPDLVLLLDLPVELALDRVDGRLKETEKFEHAEFLKQVRGRYLELAQERGYARIDASADQEATIAACIERVEELLEGEAR